MNPDAFLVNETRVSKIHRTERATESTGHVPPYNKPKHLT